MKKIWGLIVLVFVLALLSVVFWLKMEKEQKKSVEKTKQEEVAMKTEKETVGSRYDFSRDLNTLQWETYKSKKLGLTIKYPRLWKIVLFENEKAGFSLQSPVYVPEEEDNGYGGEIYVNSIPNPKNLSIKNLYGTFDDASRFWFSQSPYEEIVIMGRKSVHFLEIDELMTDDTGKAISREDFIVQGIKKSFTLATHT